jgi:hypothetical protein
MVNERSIGSIYFVSDLSLFSIGLLTTTVIGTGIIKVWTGKGMISKLVPPLNGLTSLVAVAGYTIDGVTRILLLVPISINTKLGGSYLKSRKVVW